VKGQGGRRSRRISGEFTLEPTHFERWAATAFGIVRGRSTTSRRVRHGVVLNAIVPLAWIENQPDTPTAPERETPGFPERLERGPQVIRGPPRRLEEHGRGHADEDRDQKQDDEHLDEGEAAMFLETGGWRALLHRAMPPA
jgi:hypothetical protein